MALQVFLGGDLITDTGVLADGMLIAKEGVIDYAGPRIAPPDNAEVIDSAGACIAPGFVDLHIHGGAGSDFMDATAHDVETVFRFHAAHGTTAMCPSTATASKADILACLEQLAAYDGRFGRNLGAHVEGPYLSMSKRGCHLPEFVRDPEESEWRDIVERGPIASMTLAPELPGARALVEELHRRGIVASAGHSEALYHEIDEAVQWGMRHVTHLYCAMTDAMNNRWRGTPNPRAAGIVEAVYLDDRLSSELITDGKHLSREMLLLAYRNKGYERLAIITDAMRGAGMPDGEYTFGPRHGMLAVVRDREARIPDGTALASSVYAMDEMVRVFRDLAGCPLWQAVRMASLTPAEIAGKADRIGSLAKGKFADVIFIDDAVNVSGVFLSGRRLR